MCIDESGAVLCDHEDESRAQWRSRPLVAGRAAGAVEDFDAGFFRISPREAEFMDPAQRMLIEVAYEGLEAHERTVSIVELPHGCTRDPAFELPGLQALAPST